MIPVSKLAAAVQPSATLVAGARAKQLQAQGVKVFDFSLGEPDFPTPEHICRAAVRAMQDGHTHYTAAAGLPELRAAIARSYQINYGLDCRVEDVLVSNGAKHSIHNALTAICGPGDEVIIPTPYWVSYSDLVQMVGARPVLIRTTQESSFKMNADQLAGAITPRTRLLMLNSPCNPTGTVYSPEELTQLADVILESSAAVLSDEIYERLVYGNARASCFATLSPALAQRTVTVSGASKSYAMTGWRMGWAVGPAPIIRAMENVQSQQTSSPSSISQHAAFAALQGDQSCVEAMRREFELRRDLVCRRLSAMPHIHFLVPEGAFYVFFHMADYFNRHLAGKMIADSASFCEVALDAARINFVPGSAFGAEGYVRFSFAAAREQLTAGLDQLQWLLETAS
jgi:aspartate aminotransferase